MVTTRHVTDGRYTIQSVIAGNPMIHANLYLLQNRSYGAIEVSHCGNMDFQLFCFCDLDLDPMTFICELDPVSLEIHRMCK